jgi:hypothetical protein
MDVGAWKSGGVNFGKPSTRGGNWGVRHSTLSPGCPKPRRGQQRKDRGGDAVYEKGGSLAVIYAKLKVGYVFEGRFDARGPKSEIVMGSARK